MSKLDEAQQRLERAISELEKAASAPRSSETGGGDAGLPPDAAAQTRIYELEALNADVTQRLNGAIDRVRKVLDS